MNLFISFYIIIKYFQETNCTFYSINILNIQILTSVPRPTPRAVIFWNNFNYNDKQFLQILPPKIQIYDLKYILKKFY